MMAVAECDITPTIIGLPTVADTSTGPIALSGNPAGGIFSGNGVLFNAFNPVLTGPGVHEITYTYTDPVTGCVSDTETILIFTYIDVFISYHLGTISPKLSLSTETNSDHFSDYDAFISEMSGRILHQQKVSLNQTKLLYQYNEIDLPVGLYIVTFQNDTHSFSKKVFWGR